MSDFAYTYAQPSTLATTAEGNTLALAAYAEDAPGAGVVGFFQGRLRDWWLAARGLTTLAKIVASRFVPQGAVLRAPLVTAGTGLLRVGPFSSCNGVYGRLDLGPAALDGKCLSSSTTNVDFNEPMVKTLSRIARTEPVHLGVGQQAVPLERAAGNVTERTLRNTRKLLDAYTDLAGGTRRPVPPAVQARLREWQATPALKKVATALLAQ